LNRKFEITLEVEVSPKGTVVCKKVTLKATWSHYIWWYRRIRWQ